MSNKNKQIAKISIFITSVFVIILSISYAFITSIINGEKQVVINAGVLDLVLEEENNVTLTNAYPMYDEVGMIQEDSFDFKLVNKTKNDVNYTLYLEDVTPEYITGKCSDLGEITTSSPKEYRKNNYPDDLRKEVLNTFDKGMTEEDVLKVWKEEIAIGINDPVYLDVETFEDIIDIGIDYHKAFDDRRTLVETYPENNYEKINIGFYHTGELKYYLTNDGVGEVRQFPDVYKEDGHLEDVVLDNGSIKGNQSINYSLKLWINSEVEYDFWNEYKMFSYKLKVEVNQKKEGLALRQVLDLENKVDTTTEIDFSEISSETNGRGIYKYTEDGEDIYYWRGAVTDNHIIFGGYCWEMIRTTKTGGVKMIYDGVPVGGKCANTGSDSTIGESTFYFGDRNSDVGYMLGLGDINRKMFTPPLCVKLDSSSGKPSVGSELAENDCIKAGGKWATTYYEATHANVANSKVKTYIDEWFSSSSLNSDVNLEKFEDAVYCNDRTVSANSIYGDGTGTTETYYSGFSRMCNGFPVLECTNQNDRFTVSSENGNGELAYPVGLITLDEVMLAGGTSTHDYNYDYYLYTGELYLTMTPGIFYYNVCGAYIYNVDAKGDLNDEAMSGGVRPVISLKSTVKVTDGDGTEDNPYIVE